MKDIQGQRSVRIGLGLQVFFTKFLVLFANLSTKASTQHTRQGFRVEEPFCLSSAVLIVVLLRVLDLKFFHQNNILFANRRTKASTQHTRQGLRVGGAILPIKPTEFDHTSLEQKKVIFASLQSIRVYDLSLNL